MANFWKIVNSVIAESDLVLEVLDARLVEDTRNAELETKIKKAGKAILYVVNKCDLVDIVLLRKKIKGLRPCVFVSSIKHLGTTILKQKILEIARIDSPVVGVVGYPNTGKSSVINALAGRSKARASSVSGYTRALQKIRCGRLTLLDTPGVIPFEEHDEYRHAIIGALDVSRIREPDYVAQNLISQMDGAIENYYGINISDDPTVVLELIAKKMNRLRKGGEPDIMTAARIIIKDWQKGKIIL